MKSKRDRTESPGLKEQSARENLPKTDKKQMRQERQKAKNSILQMENKHDCDLKT